VYSSNPVSVDTEGIDDIGAGSLDEAIVFNNFRRRLLVQSCIESSLQENVVIRVSARAAGRVGSCSMALTFTVHC